MVKQEWQRCVPVVLKLMTDSFSVKAFVLWEQREIRIGGLHSKVS